ncbi:fungal-specific transcription factor domain-containing protein [Trichoderma ceciliae]
MSTPAKPQNGNRPSCSSCILRGELCFYERNNWRNSRRDRAFAHTIGNVPSNSAPQVWSSWPMDEVDTLLGLGSDEMISSLAAEPPLEDLYEWMISNNKPLGICINDSCLGDQNRVVTQDAGLPTPLASQPELPELPELLQLIDLFFEKFHRYFPIMHRQTIISAINSQGIQGVPPVLLFAIVAVSAGAHPNHQIRQSQRCWYEEAKNRVSKEIQSPHHVLQTLQAAVLVIYLGLAYVDYSPSLEKATWVENEEILRISWMLFIMDRGMCFPIGLMHAIDDRRMNIGFPMPEHEFQNTDGSAPAHTGRFTHNLDDLITIIRDKSLQGSATQLQYLILGYTLLGRISEALDSTEDGYEARKERVESLCGHLVRIRLMLPRSATELSLANYNEFMQVVWLNILLNACTIFLHHRPLHEGETIDDVGTEMATNWPHCVAAARGTISILRDASRTSIDFVSNAHFPCLIFISCRVLMTEYFHPSRCRKNVQSENGVHLPQVRDPKPREDLEVAAMTYIRMKGEWRSLGQKFGKGMYFYLHQGEEPARKAKAGGARSLLGTCDTWPNIPDDYKLNIAS